MYGTEVVTQSLETQYGDSSLGQTDFADGSELDAAYAYVCGDTLFVTFAGNLQSNNNRLNIFIDNAPGGQNRLRGDNATISRMGDSGGPNGLTFDAAFEPDHWLGINISGGTFTLFVDYVDLPTSSGGTGIYLGATTTAAGGDGVLSGGTNPNGVQVTVNNSNTAGVDGCDCVFGDPCNFASGAGVVTGVELAIPLAQIGGAADVNTKICAFISNPDYSHLSNQILGAYPDGFCNTGEPRGQDFASYAGDQFFLVSNTGTPAISGLPATAEGCLGDSLSVSATIDARGPVAIQWFKDNVAIPGATSATLTYGPLTAADDGDQLTVQVCGVCGITTSAAVTIDVRDPPTANAGADQTICEGDTVSLSGSATNYSSIYWASTGTGTFDDIHSFTPVYTPSALDISTGSVTLVLNAVGQANCPEVNDALTVTINRLSSADAGSDIIECELVALQLQGSGSNGTPQWSGGLGNFIPDADRYDPIYVPHSSEVGTTVTLTLTVSGPCGSAVDTVDVTIRDATTWYADVDGDTYGNPNSTFEACDQPSGYVAVAGDCDDGNAAINPGATEVCNGVDDDCDTLVDEGVTNTYYRDADGDTYGNPNVTTQACSPPSGYVSDNTDCDDGNAAINPGATEVCNGVDDDCDTIIDEGCGNTPPTASAGGPYTAECDAAPDGHTDITLDGTGSHDPDNGPNPLTYLWTTDCPGATILNATSATATLRLTGCSASCTVTLAVSDGVDTHSAGATVTLADTAAPSVTAPADISVDADAGACAAVLSVGTATAADACDASPSISGVRSDSLALGDPYPAGVTTITWTATDGCGNTSPPAVQTVTVSDQNVFELTVELAGAGAAAFSRCMEVMLHRCGSPPVQRLVLVSGSVGVGSAVFTAPCGPYDCVTVRDPLHTLRRTIPAPPTHNARYQVNATGARALQGGNLNGDFWIDILDFGAFVGQYGTNYGSPDTLCGALPMHADFNLDGVADTADFTFIAIGFLDGNDANCCGLPGFAGPGPVAEIAVDKLHALGLSNLAIGDLNADGILNADDMIAWMQGARPLPPPPPADPAGLGDQSPLDTGPGQEFDLGPGGR